MVHFGTDKEGKLFGIVFCYHNFQRFSSVVNNHSEPICFFLCNDTGFITIYLFLYHGIFKAFKDLSVSFKGNRNVSDSLHIYSLCWLISVLLFFSISATKLPSYWLPAIPAAAILMSNSSINLKKSNATFNYLWSFNILILFGLSIAFFSSNIWLSSINDPEMPNLASDLISSRIILKARLFFSLFTFFAVIFL